MHFIIMYDCLSKISPLNLISFTWRSYFLIANKLIMAVQLGTNEVNDSGEKYYFKMSLPKSLYNTYNISPCRGVRLFMNGFIIDISSLS